MVDSISHLKAMEDRFVASLRQLLEKKAWTVYRLAKESGVSEGHLRNILSGKREPTDEVLAKLAPALEASFDQLKAWADADRLGDEGLARLRKYVLAKQEEAHETRTRFVEKRGYMELIRDELERLSQLPADHPDRAKIGDLLERNKQLDAELREELAEVDKQLDELIAFRDRFKDL